jgi:hypothetical protein
MEGTEDTVVMEGMAAVDTVAEATAAAVIDLGGWCMCTRSSKTAKTCGLLSGKATC